MSDEASALSLKYLSNRNEELAREKEAVTKESITRKKALNALRLEHDALVKQRDALLAERDSYKVKAEATPGEQAALVKGLESKLRGLEIAGKFADVSKDLNEGVTLEKLFRAAGFDPSAEGSEKVDPTELVGKLKASDAYLFKAAGTTGSASQQETKRGPLDVSTPTGRGSAQGGSGRIKVSYKDLADAGYMHQNQEMIFAAQATESVDYVP